MRNFLESGDVVLGFGNLDMSAAAQDGDYVSLVDYSAVTVVFIGGIGTAGDDPTLTLQQAKDNAGGSVKGLNFKTLYKKEGATALSGVGAWTKVTKATSDSDYGGTEEATSAENEKIWAVHVKAEDLDVANDFTHIRGNIADVGTNAQYGTILYLFEGARYSSQVTDKADVTA